MALSLDTNQFINNITSSSNSNGVAGLHDFLSLVKGKGLAAHNNYFVTIDIPRGLLSKYASYGTTLSLLCAGGDFPGVTMESRDIFWQGATKPVATNVRYSDFFLFFYIEQDMKLKTFFDDWFNLIMNPISGTVGYSDDYSTNIRIYQLDKQYQPAYAIELRNAYPRQSHPLQVAYQGNSFHKLPVVFAYRYWQNINIQYNADTQNSFWGNLLSSQGMQLINKVAPVIYGLLVK